MIVFPIVLMLAADPAKLADADLIAAQRLVIQAQAAKERALTAALAYRDYELQAQNAQEQVRKFVEELTAKAGKKGCTIDLDKAEWNCPEVKKAK